MTWHDELAWVKKKTTNVKTASFPSVHHVSAESQLGLQQHSRRPHQTCNFLKPAHMLGAYLSLTHMWGCVAAPQSFSTWPHEMLIPPSCLQSPQLALEKWLPQWRRLDGNGGSRPLFSSWTRLRFKCRSHLVHFCMSSRNLATALFYKINAFFFSPNLRCVQPAQSAFQPSWPMKKKKCHLLSIARKSCNKASVAMWSCRNNSKPWTTTQMFPVWVRRLGTCCIRGMTGMYARVTSRLHERLKV